MFIFSDLKEKWCRRKWLLQMLAIYSSLKLTSHISFTRLQHNRSCTRTRSISCSLLMFVISNLKEKWCKRTVLVQVLVIYSSLTLTSRISYTWLQHNRTELKARLEVLESVSISSTATVDERNASLSILIKIPPLIVAP
jgi:phosphatidylserine synthase